MLPHFAQKPRYRFGEDWYSEYEEVDVEEAALLALDWPCREDGKPESCEGRRTRNWASREDVHFRHIVHWQVADWDGTLDLSLEVQM